MVFLYSCVSFGNPIQEVLSEPRITAAGDSARITYDLFALFHTGLEFYNVPIRVILKNLTLLVFSDD